ARKRWRTAEGDRTKNQENPEPSGMTPNDDRPELAPTRSMANEPSTPMLPHDSLDTTATMSAPGPLTQGGVIAGRYAIGEVIGEGGFGKVYMAQDRRLDNRKVVVKTLKAAHGWYEKRFQEEVRALARMDHPGIVGVTDSGRLPDGSAFLVMQYVPGE